MVVSLLHLAALAGYLGAWAVFLRDFREGGAGRTRTGWRLAMGAAVVHLAGVVAFTLAHGTLPLVGLGPASSSLALVIAVLLLGASVREEVRPSALFVVPLILGLLSEAVAVGLEPTVRQTTFRGPWFVVHVAAVFAGYAGLALASAAAAMYVLQFRTLKRKDFGSVFGFMPSLDSLDRLNRTGLGLGFPTLTLGLVTGWSWTLTYGGGWELGNPQVVFGAVTWLAYLGAILVRVWPGGRGQKSAAATSAAFVLTLSVFAALRLFTGGSGFFL